MARTKNSIRNIIFAFCLQGVTTLINFITRTVMIRYLGMQAVSLNSLFTEVLEALSLAELGVGTAIVYNLYKPLADNDHDKVCQLMGLFRTAYRVIAAITFVIGMCVCPFIQYLVNSVDYSLGYIRIVYMLFVLNLAMSYLYTYKVSLINADQKAYVLSKINILITLLNAGVKLVVLVVTQNYIVFLVITISLTLIWNVVRSKLVDKYYPWLKGNYKKLPKDERNEVFSNIKNLFIKTLSGKITYSTDNILISALVSTIQVGLYSNYSLVIGVFRQIANQIAYGGIGASLGNLLVTESHERCEKVFYRLVYLFYVVAAIGCVGVFCCITPFIMVWLKSEEYILDTCVVLVCCINLFIEVANRPLWSIMEVSGLFKFDKYASIAGSIVNLIVSVVLGLKMGMLGIFIGTFLTFLIQVILKAYLLFTMRLNSSPAKYYFYQLLMFAALIIQLVVSSYVCSLIQLSNYVLKFLLCGAISVGITAGSILSVTCRTDACRYYLDMIKGLLRRKKK